MKLFLMAFTLSISGFAVANFVSLAVRSDGIDDAEYSERCGFPFLFFAESHYNDSNPYFSHVALAADIGVAVVVSLSVARYHPSIRDEVLRTLGIRPKQPVGDKRATRLAAIMTGSIVTSTEVMNRPDELNDLLPDYEPPSTPVDP
jgi:hypothetical protein